MRHNEKKILEMWVNCRSEKIANLVKYKSEKLLSKVSN
jgi:hypothetical protein